MRCDRIESSSIQKRFQDRDQIHVRLLVLADLSEICFLETGDDDANGGHPSTSHVLEGRQELQGPEIP